MRLTILAVGRLKSGPELSLIEDYAARLSTAPASLGPLAVREIDERRAKPGDLAAAVGAARGRDTRLIALDERGQMPTSRAFADQLGAWRDQGVREAIFVIGGADGLDETLRASADLVLAFGRLTLPHILARVVLAEQLYRAASLAAGHPYHRD